MLQAKYLYFEIVLLIAMICSGEQPSPQSITDSRQNHVNDEGQEGGFEDDHNDDFHSSREDSFKKTLVPGDFNSTHEGIRDELYEEDEVQATDPNVFEYEPANTNPHFAKLNENRRRTTVNPEGQLNEMEAQFIIKYDLKPLDFGNEKSRKLTASDEMIERISIIQNKIVLIRQRLLENMLKRAYEVTTDIDNNFPSKHSCSVQMYNELIRQDWPLKYPYGFLNMVRSVKEALLKSWVDKIPIALVDEDVYKRLDFAMNRLGDRLREHGKLAYQVFEDLAIGQKRAVRKFCNVPRRTVPVDLHFDD